MEPRRALQARLIASLRSNQHAFSALHHRNAVGDAHGSTPPLAYASVGRCATRLIPGQCGLPAHVLPKQESSLRSRMCPSRALLALRTARQSTARLPECCPPAARGARKTGLAACWLGSPPALAVLVSGFWACFSLGPEAVFRLAGLSWRPWCGFWRAAFSPASPAPLACSGWALPWAAGSHATFRVARCPRCGRLRSPLSAGLPSPASGTAVAVQSGRVGVPANANPPLRFGERPTAAFGRGRIRPALRSAAGDNAAAWKYHANSPQATPCGGRRATT